MPLSLSAAESAAVVPTRPSGSTRAGLRLQIALCAAAAFGLALLWQAQGGWVFPLDDAYITLHNAAVLREGADANFGVPALAGATSLIHLALVALLSLALPLVLASYVVAGAGVLGLLTGLVAMARERRAPVRHPQAGMNQGAFLMRRLENVRAAFSLTALADDVRRVLTRVGVPGLIAAVRA